MRVFTCLLLVASSAFAYQVTSPGGNQGWTTSGPNYLTWVRVDTDPANFTAVLENDNTGYNEILYSNVDGTLGTLLCSAPSGGWTTGFAFRVNLAQDPEHLGTLLAQSNQFNITATSSGGSTMSSASIQTGTPSVATTTPGVTSSDTSTTPTGTSAATLGADTRAGFLTAVAALTALVTTLF